MKKLIVLFFLLPSLLFAGGIQQKHKSVIAAKSVASGGSYTDITFFWRCEGTTLGGDDYSAGDTTATTGSGAVINTDAVKIGTNGADFPTTYDRFEFDVSSNDIFSGTKGRVGYWLQAPTLTSSESRTFRIETSGDEYFTITLTDAGTLETNWNDGSNHYYDSSVGVISAGTFYFIEFAYDTTANTRILYIDGVAETTNTDTIAAITPLLLTIGSDLGALADDGVYIDNVMISNDNTRDFCGLSGTCVGIANDTVSPR